MVTKAGAGLTGGLSGAATGAALGSVVPGLGTAAGGGIGALLGALGSYFSAEPDRFGQVSTKTPEQEAMLRNISSNFQNQQGNYQAASDYLSKLLSRDPETYDRFAAPYMRQFEEQTIPQISERFAGLGGGLGSGGLASSGFAQALGGAGAQLQSNLAGLFANLQQNAAGQAFNQYNNLGQIGLGTQAFTPTYQPGTTGLAGGLTSGLAQGAGQFAGKNLMDNIFEYLKNNKSTGTDVP